MQTMHKKEREFQSTPSVQRETKPDYVFGWSDTISIHSLYAEGDSTDKRRRFYNEDFNPLPLCRGRLRTTVTMACAPLYFNPLPLCRGRLRTTVTMACAPLYFNPLPLCRGRRVAQLSFQSTPSMQRETARGCI